MKRGIDTSVELAELRKIPANKRCFDCSQAGTTYAVPELGIFLCSICGGIHREFNHRVKGLSTCNFNETEVNKLKNMGNEKAAFSWMGRHDPRVFPIPDLKDANKLKDFLRLKYLDKRFYENREAPPVQAQPEPPKPVEKKLEKAQTSNFINLLDDEPAPVYKQHKASSEISYAANQNLGAQNSGNFFATNFPPPNNPGMNMFPQPSAQFPPVNPLPQYSQGNNPQPYPPANNPQTYPPANNPQSYPPANNPQSYPPANNPQSYPPANNPQSYPPANNPQSYPPANNPQSYPPANNPQSYQPANNSQNYPPANNPQSYPQASNPPNYPPANNPQSYPQAKNPQNYPSVSNPQSYPPQNPQANNPQNYPSANNPQSYPSSNPTNQFRSVSPTPQYPPSNPPQFSISNSSPNLFQSTSNRSTTPTRAPQYSSSNPNPQSNPQPYSTKPQNRPVSPVLNISGGFQPFVSAPNYSAQASNFPPSNQNFPQAPSNYPPNYNFPQNYPSAPTSNPPPAPIATYNQFPSNYNYPQGPSLSPPIVNPSNQAFFSKPVDPFEKIFEEEREKKLIDKQKKMHITPAQNLMIQQYTVQAQMYQKNYGVQYPYTFQQWVELNNPPVPQESRPHSKNPFDMFA
ncbi:hypothetical protein SteCoe_21450 [Stentor coeruleus]|uniref:Arf-GAP domain-containing protein n=1 Tax=Stentor coeruleus TaxID=5963 RepID=A0A1R2BQ14_9CILI|nr:hypothetical protein SteCoe_21450 [Stentor coeruleus]